MGALVLAMVLWQALSEPSTEPAAKSESSSSSTRATVATPTGPSTPPTAGDPTLPTSAASSPDDATATPSVSTSAMSTGTATGTPAPAAPPVPAGAQEAASGFVTAWARPSLPAEQWLAGVRAYLAPDLERSMAYADPARIPASKVVGPASMVHVAPDSTAASFEVPTNAGAIRVEVVLVRGRWLATDIVPAAVTAPGD